jgi:regulator of sigma E protease
MSEPKGLPKKNFRLFLLLAVVGAVVYLIARNISAFGNVLLVIVGFGVMVLVHELGHFVVAKLSGIKVTAFSLGFPPTLFGILRTEQGYRVRILPGFFRAEEDEKSDGSLLTFAVGRKAQPGETEYRIGLIPFGGYNKILGQEDTKAVETSDDPRSFANKPVGVRMAVIAAGVTFNAISAILIFMIVFLIGINLMPPVVGGVVPDSPAAQAGLKAGDEIIEIAGRSDNLDFRNIVLAALLSGRDEKITLKAKRGNDTLDFALAAEQIQTTRGQMRAFGIEPPMSLTIANVSDPDALYAKTGLKPGDRIKSVSGRDVEAYWELEEIVRDAFVPSVTVLAERTDPVSKNIETVESQISLNFNFARREVESETELSHIYSMVPRLRITAVAPVSRKTRVRSLLDKIKGKLLVLLGKESRSKESVGGGLESGDIILAIGNVRNPTYKEFREVTTEPIEVLRADSNGVEETLTVTVVPKRSKDGKRVVIGIFLVPAIDFEHPVVAKTIAAEGGPAKLEIPRGASITAVDKTAVSNFYDVIREIRRYDGERITIDWRIDEKVAGDVALDVGEAEDFIALEPILRVPLEPLERLYKAGGPVDAIAIGYRKTSIIVVQTYLSIRRLIEGLVGQEELSGPVGIIAITYQIAAERPLIELLHFVGLISVLLAVFNLLPLPPFDGGWLVLLAVEKIKGSALSERVQEIIAYAGVMFILALFVYLTFNDILNIFFR